MAHFRERLLARLVEKHAIPEELGAKLLSWRHPGFSVHVGEPIPPDDPKAIEDMADYVEEMTFGVRSWEWGESNLQAFYQPQ
jgi:hypothetical protein